MESNLTMGFRLDENGFIVERPVVNLNDTLPYNVILNPPIMPFIKPKWTGAEWTEGATQEEIEESTKVEPSPPTQAEILEQRLADLEIMLAEILFN